MANEINPKYTPQVGDYVTPDGWKFGEHLTASDNYSDSSFPGCQFRLPASGYSLAVNVTITGRNHFVCSYGTGPMYRSRAKIEFVGDGEPSTFTHGWVYHN